MRANDVVAAAEALRAETRGQRVVFVSGNFNIVHPGHVRLINFARSCGDSLVVGVFVDGEPGVVVPLELRLEALESIAAVKEVVPLRVNDVVPFVLALQPYAVVKGKEQEVRTNPEREALLRYGGHLIFFSGDIRFSAIDIIRRESSSLEQTHFVKTPDFFSKHSIDPARLQQIVESFSQVRALVIGDLIIDEYIHCDALGMSQEDPTIVVTPVESQRFTGGAGIVAGHVAGLGGRATFLSIIGDDHISEIASRSLSTMSVEHELIRDPTRPTILKQRYRASGKTLLRVSHLRSHDSDDRYLAQMIEAVDAHLATTDVLIFSDFNYGCLPQTLVDYVIERCKELDIPFVADSQASSQVGDVSRFRGAAFISATEREARLAVNDFKSSIQNVANLLIERTQSNFVLVKLGAEGLLVVTRQPTLATSNLPALNSRPLDVAGAGDALLATSSLALSAGATPWECAYLGSLAAGLQVSRLGNLPLQHSDVWREVGSCTVDL